MSEPRQEAEAIVDKLVEAYRQAAPVTACKQHVRLVGALAAFIEEKDAENWYAMHCQEPGAAERLHNAYQAGREALSALRGEQR